MTGFLSVLSRVTVNFQQMSASQDVAKATNFLREKEGENSSTSQEALIWMQIITLVIMPLVLPQVLFMM